MTYMRVPKAKRTPRKVLTERNTAASVGPDSPSTLSPPSTAAAGLSNTKGTRVLTAAPSKPRLKRVEVSRVEYGRTLDDAATITHVHVTLGIVTDSQRHRHRFTERKVTQNCRALAMLMLGQVDTAFRPLVKHVHLVRLSPRSLDPFDNERVVLKPFVDQVAAWLAGDNTPKGKGDDSASARVQYSSSQHKQRAYGVRIELQL